MKSKEENAGASAETARERRARPDGSAAGRGGSATGRAPGDGAKPLAGQAEEYSRRQELREARERLEIALDAAEMGAWDKDLVSGFTHTNARFNEVFGYREPHPAWGRQMFREHVLPEDRDAIDPAYERAIATGEYDLEVRVRWPDASVHWVQLRGRVYFDERRQPLRSAGVIMDVTRRKESEEALRRLNETLEEHVEQRSRQVRDLARQLTLAEEEERRRFSQVLHDDLQQILFGIRLRASELHSAAQKGRDPQLAGALKQIDGWVGSAIGLTRQLSVWQSPAVLQHEDLLSAFEWLGGQMQELHGLAVEVRAGRPFSVPDMSLRLLYFQIVRELLFNVKKHAGIDDATVTLREQDGHLVIEVADEGDGFSPGSSPGWEHSGLANVQRRLGLLGGRIEVWSAPGQGTKVTVHAPANSSSGESPGTPPPGNPADPGTGDE